MTGVPPEPAPTSLSRTAIRRLAIPLSRQTLTIRIESTNTMRENQAKARSEKIWIPKRVGLEMSVEPGSGNPVQTVLWMNGRVTHGVASTDVCMKTAKPNVLTAR